MSRQEEAMEEQESLTDEQKAYRLYLNYVPIRDIAEEVGRARSTIYYWVSQGWKQKREELQAQASQEIERQNVEWRKKLAKPLVEEAEHIIGELPRSRTRDLANTARALADVIKTLSLLLGTPTEIEEHRVMTFKDLIMIATGADPSSDRIPQEGVRLLGDGE